MPSLLSTYFGAPAAQAGWLMVFSCNTRSPSDGLASMSGKWPRFSTSPSASAHDIFCKILGKILFSKNQYCMRAASHEIAIKRIPVGIWEGVAYRCSRNEITRWHPPLHCRCVHVAAGRMPKRECPRRSREHLPWAGPLLAESSGLSRPSASRVADLMPKLPWSCCDGNCTLG